MDGTTAVVRRHQQVAALERGLHPVVEHLPLTFGAVFIFHHDEPLHAAQQLQSLTELRIVLRPGGEACGGAHQEHPETAYVHDLEPFGSTETVGDVDETLPGHRLRRGADAGTGEQHHRK